MERNKEELDPDEVSRFAEQMFDVVKQKASEDASFLDDLRADLFHASLSCQEDHVELLTILEDLQRRIGGAEQALREVQDIDPSVLSNSKFQKERDDLLHREKTLKVQERSLQDSLENLSKSRQTLQSKKELLKKLNAETQRNQMVLSLCASTFHMIASDGGENGVAGSMVDSKGSVVDNFKLKTVDMDAFEVCEKLWSLCTMS